MTVAGLDPAKVAQLIDYFCVETDPIVLGKVNLNTAPVEVIAALPGSSEGLAQAVIARRDQEPFRSLGDVVAFFMEQPGGPGLFGQMIDRVTTKSSTFLVEAMGRTDTGRGFRTLTALMRRTQDNVLVIRQAEEDWPLTPLPAPQPRTARR
jgi:type II secretory pathway component PulK